MISPVGEPGCGKSTFSLWLCQALKLHGIQTEFVPEVIKYESYDHAAMTRVASGTIDHRLLRRQQHLIKPLAGKVEVVVNDGPLEPFLYYAKGRVAPGPLRSFRELLGVYRKQLGECEHRFVAPVRKHAYEMVGRRQGEAEAGFMRNDLLNDLQAEFGIVPTLLTCAEERQSYLNALVGEVLTRRRLLGVNRRFSACGP